MSATLLIHDWNPDTSVCRVCGVDGSSSLTGGSPCAGTPLVDVHDEHGVAQHAAVPLRDCFPEPDDYADALAALTREDSEVNRDNSDGVYWVGGGAAPLIGVRIARLT